MEKEKIQGPQSAEDLKQQEEKLRLELLAKGKSPEEAELAVLKQREAYSEAILHRVHTELPQPFLQTAALNKRVWADGTIDATEMRDLSSQQEKLKFNFYLMRDLMDKLASNGEYAQHGKLFEVRDRYERLRRALRMNTTSIRRAKYSNHQRNRRQRKDKNIVLHLNSREVSLVQGMLKGLEKTPLKQDERNLQHGVHTLQYTR